MRAEAKVTCGPHPLMASPQWLLLCVILPLLALATHGAAQTTTSFTSSGHKVTYDIFTQSNPKQTLILLHGTSGPDAPLYREQAAFYAQQGFRVLLLHYFDATSSHAANESNYKAWAQAVADLVGEQAKKDPGTVDVVGYSLGASIALAAGSQGLPVKAIAEWYGSLPDYAFYSFKAMPPLLILHGARDTNIPVTNAQQLQQLCGLKALACDARIYPDEAHGFGGLALADAQRRTLDFFAKYATR